MRKSLTKIFTVIITISFTLLTYAQKEKKEIKDESIDYCVSCHTENDILPNDYSNYDVHRISGLSCSGCHGGDKNSNDQDIAMSPAKGFVGVPNKKDIPQFCGKCHSNINIMRTYQPRIATDQVEQYYTSMHGKRLKAGDKNVAECTSCHTAHSILPASDPRSTTYALNVPNTCNKCHGNKELMDKYNLPSNQMSEYVKSVHGIDLLEKKDTGAPACNDCHGNHGAMPPGVTSISYVCGTCHVNNMNYFNASPMAEPFKELDYHGCEQCHGNHGIKKTSDDMVGVGKNSTCIDCHNEGDNGYIVAKTISSYLSSLNSKYSLAEKKLIEVRDKGMNDIEIGYLLQDAKQNLIESRTLVHTFDTVKVGSTIIKGIDITTKAISLADAQIDEYYTRRNGFAFATAVFLILAVGLFFKIKSLRK
ncbi:cytochrome c3 family protein [Melioribacteraceae bacterium 4301-Me]|uniref:cytochrome c3 family protein n=1 Tax=Pyranulibacter aquaticus TaxID=3163344 RepID=UPI003596DE94